MKFYRPSQELIDIFLKNGFRDKSYWYRETFGKKYAQKGTPYSTSQKKALGIGYGKRKLEIYFDYSNIAVVSGSAYITAQLYKISELQLRSIIAFFKVSYQRQDTLKRYCNYKIEDAGSLMYQQRMNGNKNPPFDSFFEGIFKSVEI